jgi:hypothetical protein
MTDDINWASERTNYSSIIGRKIKILGKILGIQANFGIGFVLSQKSEIVPM